MQTAYFQPHLNPKRGVQVRQRLIEQEDFRIPDNRPSDRHPLTLSAREFLRLAIKQVSQLQDLGDIVYPLLDRALVGVRKPEAECHVLENTHMRIERIALKHHRDLTVGRCDIVHHPAGNRKLAA